MSEKYPPETDRRRFVRGVVGSTALAGVATGSTAAIGVATQRGTGGGGPTTYVGIENTKGPAPRAMPLVPLELDEEGYLRGQWPEVRQTELDDGRVVTVAEEEIAGITYSSRWFQYCGVQAAEGVDPTADQDNYLRVAPGTYAWQSNLDPGSKLHLDDLADYREWGNGIGTAGIGKPAQCTWRSVAEGDEEVKKLPVQLVRSEQVPEAVERLRNAPPRKGGDIAAFVDEATVEGCIAWLNKCTHFCCVPGFKDSANAAKCGAANEVYCGCHQSVYDPFAPVRREFIALPRPEE